MTDNYNRPKYRNDLEFKRINHQIDSPNRDTDFDSPKTGNNFDILSHATRILENEINDH